MIATIGLFVLGLVLICLGGDRLVDAAVAIARRLKIPEIVVGATIVSLGTTLPEILVSTTAAFEGSASISVGNALGSIICNTALIAGMTQLISPAKKVSRSSILWRIVLFFSVICAMIVAGNLTGGFRRPVGVLLLLCFVFYAFMNVKFPGGEDEEEEEKEEKDGSLVKELVTLAICAALLYVGSNLLVDNGIILAEKLGVPERVIAVTFIALGTSLPELVTSLTSIIKGYGNVGLGNIVGANILNLLLVIGIPATITGMPVEERALLVDAPLCMLVMAVLTVPLIFRQKSSRIQGAALLIIYVTYAVSQFMMV